jgi:hypothetical protein
VYKYVHVTLSRLAAIPFWPIMAFSKKSPASAGLFYCGSDRTGSAKLTSILLHILRQTSERLA